MHLDKRRKGRRGKDGCTRPLKIFSFFRPICIDMIYAQLHGLFVDFQHATIFNI